MTTFTKLNLLFDFITILLELNKGTLYTISYFSTAEKIKPIFE